jgi:hypothetical protein
MALSQLLGGWTKWGLPRLSIAVFITAFIPVAIVSLWIILAGEPGGGWFHNHVMAWSRDIHVSRLVTDFLYYIPVLAFGTGLVFGFSFDTTGPVVRERDVIVDRQRDVVPVDNRRRGLFGRRRTVTPTTTDRTAADEPMTAERDGTTTSTDRTTDRETVR